MISSAAFFYCYCYYNCYCYCYCCLCTSNSLINLYTQKQNNMVSEGLLYAILVQKEPDRAIAFLRFVTLVLQDGLEHFIATLLQLIDENYVRMSQVALTQLAWLLQELIRLNISRTEHVCGALMRQIPGGNTSQGSLWLTHTMLMTMKRNITWLLARPSLCSLMVYHFLRLISEHTAALTSVRFSASQARKSLQELRKDEIDMCAELLVKTNDWHRIGRDVVRLLQYNSDIPQFASVWKTLRQQPDSSSSSSLSSSSSSLSTTTLLTRLLATPTDPVFLQCRLTTKMESQIQFVLTKVRVSIAFHWLNTHNTHNTIQHNTTQYNTIQHNTTQYNTIQHNTTQYNTIRNTTIHTIHNTHNIRNTYNNKYNTNTIQIQYKYNTNTIQYSTNTVQIQYNTIQAQYIQYTIHTTTQYTIQYNTTQCTTRNTIQQYTIHNTIQYNTQHNTNTIKLNKYKNKLQNTKHNNNTKHKTQTQ